MPATSGSYSANNIKGELIIRKAYELIGMPLSMVTAEQYNSALNIINFIVPNLGEKPRTCSASFQHIKWEDAIL